MNMFYQTLHEEKEIFKKLGYFLFQRNNELYLYQVKTGTLKKIKDNYFGQLKDFALFYTNEEKLTKSFSIQNSDVDLLYLKNDNEISFDVTIHLSFDSTIELSLKEDQVALDFYNGNAFQFADLKINPTKKEYTFYFEENMNKAAIFYGSGDVYYSSSWSSLDCINNFYQDETSFLNALVEVLTSSTVKEHYQMCFEIIERYIPGISSILEEYPILNSQKEILENNKTLINKKVYKRICEKTKK